MTIFELFKNDIDTCTNLLKIRVSQFEEDTAIAEYESVVLGELDMSTVLYYPALNMYLVQANDVTLAWYHLGERPIVRASLLDVELEVFKRICSSHQRSLQK
jgi:hypothetical protein